MELGHEFHRLKSFYKDDIKSFKQMCDRAFDDKNSKTKMIKCHQFAYNLDWLHENIPNSNILLVKRGKPKNALIGGNKQAVGIYHIQIINGM